MWRRPLLARRAMMRRPVLGAAVIGGLGYLIGRRQSEPGGATARRLADLHALHDRGQLTEDEFARKRADLLRDL